MPQIRRPSETFIDFGFVFDKIGGKYLILFLRASGLNGLTGSTQIITWDNFIIRQK
jgi:hypothetical protein